MDNISKTTLNLFLIAFLLPVIMTAQPQQCIDFEGLENGSSYGEASGHQPHDEIYEEDGVVVSLEEFHYFNGTTGFGNALITNDIFGEYFHSEGLYVFPSNINLHFDFSNQSQPVTALCLQFLDGGGEENISVNGEPVRVLESFLDAPTEIAPGVILDVFTDPNSNLLAGTLCLSGPIESLLIGGQEFALDAICFTSSPPFPCSLMDVEAQIIGCNDNGSYNVKVNTTSANDINIPISLSVDGLNVGQYELTDFPVILEGLIPADDAEFFHIGVCEAEYPQECCLETEVALSDCSPATCLGFEEMTQVLYGGNAGNQPGDQIYTENDIAVSLVPLQRLDWTTSFEDLLVIQETDFPDFAAAIGQFIKHSAISSAFNFSQYPGNVQSLTFDFYYEHGEVNFSANGAPVTLLPNLEPGIFNIAPGVDLEIIYTGDEPFAGSATVTGNLTTLLLGGVALSVDNLCINPSCSIDNLSLEATPCNNNNQFEVKLDFDYEYVSENFELWINGNAASIHEYADVPLTLGPFFGPLEDELQIEVRDLAHPDCGAATVFGPVVCEEECFIGDLHVEQLPCNGIEGIFVEINFEHEQVGDYFHLIVNDNFYDEFSYSDLPVIAGPFNASPNEVLNLFVLDQSELCFSETDFFPGPCFDECTITDIVVEPHPCEEGYFFADVAFYSTNTGPLGYYIFVNGTIFGPFSYDQDFVTLGPFEGDGTTVYDFLILDISNPACFGYKELELIDCNNTGPCEIYDLVVDPLECNPNGTYGIAINFEVDNPGNEFFEVFDADFNLLGYYPIADLPIVIEDFHPSGNDFDWIKVCINDVPDCCRVAEFEALNCGGGDCQIYEVIAEAHPCDENGQFLVDIDFQFENVGSSGFKIQGNGVHYGTFSYEEEYVTIGPPDR